MTRISPALLLVAVIVAWPLTSYGCDDGMIGPCAPDGRQSESATKSEDQSGAAASDGTVAVFGSLAKTAVDDAAYILTSPLRIDSKSVLILGGVAAGIGGLMVVDKPIQRAFQENRTTATNDLARSLETIGFARTILGANVALLSAAWWFRAHEDGNKLMRTALVSLESQLMVEGIAGLTKLAVGRARPRDGEGVHVFGPFESFEKSFPSNHAARSFAVAAVFAEAYPQPVPILAYTAATVISLSRIHLNEHFASDVVAGAALGFFVGKALSWRHKQPDFMRGWSVLPFVPEARGGLGLTMEYRF